jgi:hydrogenase nickel incorporation protein HypB
MPTRIAIAQNILAANETLAKANRDLLEKHGIYAINFMSAPGAGKTTLLDATIAGLVRQIKIGVIEGDIATTADADRLAHHNIPIVQVNTEPFGGDCHLEARMVGSALQSLPLGDIKLLLIENIGNLVCPAEFQLGEHIKAALLSVTEGEDKPLKYPLMFREADILIVTKIDLLPHLKFSIEKLRGNVRQINPKIEIFEVSAESGVGMDDWIHFLLHCSQDGIRPERHTNHCGEAKGHTHPHKH